MEKGQPLALSDQLIQNTVPLAYEAKEGPKSATGFFCTFGEDKGKVYPVIVTNKHVISEAVGGIEFTQTFHDDQSRPNYEKIKTFKRHREWCLGHPDKEIDLAVIPLGRPEDYFGTIMTVPLEQWADAAYMEDLTAIEEIIMVGYPWGLSDEVHNLPIVRRGITATLPYIDHNGHPEFLIDCACFPGSSGSPVFLYSLSPYFDKKSNMYVHPKKIRFKFLGVLSRVYGGKKAPSEFHNLGVVIKAAQLKKLDEEIDQLARMPPAAQGEELEKLFEERIAHWKPLDD